MVSGFAILLSTTIQSPCLVTAHPLNFIAQRTWSQVRSQWKGAREASEIVRLPLYNWTLPLIESKQTFGSSQLR